MKKSLFAILAIAACFASCSKVVESPVLDNAISFDNYVGKDAMTKASVVTLNDIDNVLVNACLFYKKDAATHTFTSNFMNAQAVNAQNGTYSPEKYWPAKDQAIDFVAWVPEAEGRKDSEGNALNNIEVENATLTFTVPQIVTDQTDLIVAEPVLLKNGADESGADKVVDLTFKHLLSRIAFEISASGLPTASNVNKVELNFVRLEGTFASSGTVAMNVSPIAIAATTTGEGDSKAITSPTQRYELTGPNFGWDDNIMHNDTENTVSGPTANLENSYIMLIPDMNVPSKVSVQYTVTTFDDKGVQVGEPIVNLAEFPYTTAFEAGHAYKFIFNVSMDKIEFDVQEESWSAETVNELNPDDKTSTGGNDSGSEGGDDSGSEGGDDTGSEGGDDETGA